MKRYLINGLLALVVGNFAASCADHDVDYVPLVEKKTQAYDQAFKEMIGGDIDPNQNWGFEVTEFSDDFDPLAAARARTRNNGQDGAINVNGNMWTECPGVRVNEEVDAIFNYVKNGTEWMTQNNKPFSTKAPKNLNGYFVTQVRSGNNNYADNTYPLTYKQDGGQLTNVGQYMNHLQIAFNQNPSMADLNAATSHDNISGWEHINNFNASANIDWGASDSKEKGNTKVENKGAYDFAYHSSYDEQYHNKWILVDGANISSDPYYADFYYVCFDFESKPKGNTTFYTYTDSNGQSQNGELSGTYFTNEELAAELAKQGITDQKDINIYRYMHGDKMVAGDNKYTDWIIRITKGESTPPPSTTTTTTYHMKCKRLAAQGRVFCEDLGQAGRKDIDFNDIVFDARIWWTYEFDREFDGTNYQDKNWTNFKYEAEICLLAAGGTIASKAAGNDVHSKFGVGLTTMVNTFDDHADKENMVTWGDMAAEKNPVTFTYDMTSIITEKGNISLDYIPIEVLWTNEDANNGTMQSVGVLNANLGDVPHKICAPIGTVWPSERRNIKDTYPNFEAWATDRTAQPTFHENPNEAYLYTGNTTGLPLKDAYGRDYFTVNDGNIYTNYTWEEVKDQTTYAATETILWSNDAGYAYGADGTGAPSSLTLYSTTFNAGDKLRVYGSKQADGGWITFHYDENGWQAIVSSGDQGTTSGTGYFDIPVSDANDASHLSNGPTLYIAANNFTITKIAKLVVSQQ